MVRASISSRYKIRLSSRLKVLSTITSSFLSYPLTLTPGTRPLCSYLGGGDLDGDEYTVIPLDKHPGLVIQPQGPGSYQPAQRKELHRPCTHSDIANFVTDYIISDNLGLLSLTWRIIADQRGIFDPDCLKLADLHSKAVDYPKSGLPVPMNDIPRRPRLLPDWYAPETMTVLDPEKFYRSDKAIGKLFRAIDLRDTQTILTAERSHLAGADNDTTIVDPFADSYAPPPIRETDPRSVFLVVHRQVFKRLKDCRLVSVLRDIRDIYLAYRYRLQSICAVHTLSRSRHAMLTEAEVFVGTIVANTSQPARRLDHISKIRDETTMLVDDVRDSLMGGAEIATEQRLYRAYFAWRRSLEASSETEVFGLRSFGWIALSVVFEAMKDLDAACALNDLMDKLTVDVAT